MVTTKFCLDGRHVRCHSLASECSCACHLGRGDVDGSRPPQGRRSTAYSERGGGSTTPASLPWEDEARKLRAEGLTWAEIGELLKLRPHYLSRICGEKTGSRTGGRPSQLDRTFPPERRARIKHMYEVEGLTWRAIGEAEGVDHSYLRKLMAGEVQSRPKTLQGSALRAARSTAA